MDYERASVYKRRAKRSFSVRLYVARGKGGGFPKQRKDAFTLKEIWGGEQNRAKRRREKNL